MTTPVPADACCIAGENGPLGQPEAEAAAARFKALADPMRLRLLSQIAAANCSDVCGCTLTEPLGITQPTVSHHMKKLVEAGLVTREQRGRMAHYSIVPEAFDQIRDIVDVRGSARD